MADFIQLLLDHVANQIAAGRWFNARFRGQGIVGECHRCRCYRNYFGFEGLRENLVQVTDNGKGMKV